MATQNVSIQETMYVPNVVDIAVGDRVNWMNRDRVKHTATGDGWSSGPILSMSSSVVEFTEAGSFDYRCEYTQITGTVRVKAK